MGAGLRNPRWTIVAFCAIFALYKWGDNTRISDLEGLTISTQLDATCPTGSVQVRIVNHKAQPLLGVQFNLRGFRPNYSEHIAYQSFNTDRIIPASAHWANCWSIDDFHEIPASQRRTLRWEPELVRVDLPE